MRYIKQLDGLRAVAVSLVIAGHWFPEDHLVNRITNGGNGFFGVTIFFVLSGFLITWILLENKEKAAALEIKKTTVIKNFFIRRALRIFPIYYITIAVLWVFHGHTYSHIRENIGYFLTYTFNIWVYKNQQWDGMATHLWSLSVEEQFYLIWPWVILFCRKEYLKTVILFFVCIGIGSSYIFAARVADTLTTSCFDAFGLGALLSLQLVYHPQSLKRFYSIARIGGMLCLLLWIFLIASKLPAFIPLRTMYSGIALWMIAFVVLHRNNATGINRILNNNLLVGMGKISYGIYLFHLPLLYIMEDVFFGLQRRGSLVLPEPYFLALMLICSFVLLIAISMLSWTWIEKPFLNLKRRVELRAATSDVAANGPVPKAYLPPGKR